MSTGERRHELDGLRGIAILLVLIGHAGAPYGLGPFAAAGVTLFFALSGYLITGILVAEHQRTGCINLPQFYTRRMTRLAPPLLVMLAVTAPLAAVNLSTLLPVLTWTGNYASLAGADITPYGHTWSLAAEEQFYLLWPLALLALTRSRQPTWLLAGVVVALFLWRGWLTSEGALIYAYAALETVGATLLGGCLVALVRWRASALWGLAGLTVTLGLPAAAAALRPHLLWLVVPFLVTPAVVVLVAAAERCRWLAWRPLAFCGLASYSMYLWHEPVSHLLDGRLDWQGVTLGAAAGLIAYAMVEVPLMRWRSATTACPTGRLDGAILQDAAACTVAASVVAPGEGHGAPRSVQLDLKAQPNSSVPQ